ITASAASAITSHVVRLRSLRACDMSTNPRMPAAAAVIPDRDCVTSSTPNIRHNEHTSATVVVSRTGSRSIVAAFHRDAMRAAPYPIVKGTAMTIQQAKSLRLTNGPYGRADEASGRQYQ